MSAANRFRRLLAHHGWTIALVLLVFGVAAIGGGWYVYQNPPTETVTETKNRQRIATQTETSAVVTGNSSLYRNGTVLRDMPVYFLGASPILDLDVETSVPPDRRVTVTHRLVLEYRAERRGSVFWERSRLLAADRETVTDGNATSSVALNMTRIEDRINEVERVIGNVGELRTVIRLNVTYDTGDYSGRLEARSSPVVAGNAYWLSTQPSASRTHSKTVTRTVERPPDPLVYYGLGGTGALLVLLALAVVVLQFRGLDVEEIETVVSHSRYEEWISEGEFPTGSDRRYIRIETLEDLVDVAIDSNKRVVYDTEFEAYAVIDGDLIYYFSPDPDRIDSWLDI